MHTVSNRIKKDKLLGLEIIGVVHEIQWVTRNHNLPHFVIKSKDSKLIDFQGHRIDLNENQIKVGDSFIKLAGSDKCDINNVEVICLNKEGNK